MSLQKAQRTTNEEKVAQTIVSAFTPLPIFKYLTHNASFEENIKEYKQKIKAYESYPFIEIVESYDHEAIAIWLQPFNKVPVLSTPEDVLIELKEKVAEATPDYLKSGDYWYLFYLARDSQSNTKGAVSSVVKPYLQRAEAEGKPVVLEAATPHARDVYKHWGFKVISDIVIGEGRVNAKGDPDVNGEGVTLFFMVYNGKE